DGPYAERAQVRVIASFGLGAPEVVVVDAAEVVDPDGGQCRPVRRRGGRHREGEREQYRGRGSPQFRQGHWSTSKTGCRCRCERRESFKRGATRAGRFPERTAAGLLDIEVSR